MCTSGKRGLDRGPVKALATDHDQPSAPRLIQAPMPIELLPKAGSHALHEQPHRFARHVEEPFDSQNIVAGGNLNQTANENFLIRKGGNLEDERVEIVMIVFR